MAGKTTGEVAEMLGTTEVRLNELIRHGKIARPEKVGGKRRWAKKDIDLARVAVAQNPHPKDRPPATSPSRPA